MLLDGWPMGLLAVIESECFIPRGTDVGFLNKFDDAFGSGRSKYFVRPKVRSKEMEDAFTIRHYAGDVLYRASGWLEKAKGVVRGDIQSLLHSSSCPLLESLSGSSASGNMAERGAPSTVHADAVTTSPGPVQAQVENSGEASNDQGGGLGVLLASLGHAVGSTIGSAVRGYDGEPLVSPPPLPGASGAGSVSGASAAKATERSGTKRSTVGTQFAAELAGLVQLLSQASCRFIRCIKPNMLKAPENFDGSAVLRQLKYTGTCECVTLLRVGFPVSFTFAEAADMLRPLAARISVRSHEGFTGEAPVSEAVSPPSLVWLQEVIELELVAARDELPPDSSERTVTAWAWGRTKVFMRGFLFAHLGRQRELIRGHAARSPCAGYPTRAFRHECVY